MDEIEVGVGGGARVGNVEAARFGRWTRTSLGPDLSKLEATLTFSVPPWLAGTVTLWIERGPFVLEWTVDDVAVEGAALVAIVTKPAMKPAGGF